jgi:hypothetical protein
MLSSRDRPGHWLSQDVYWSRTPYTPQDQQTLLKLFVNAIQDDMGAIKLSDSTKYTLRQCSELVRLFWSRLHAELEAKTTFQVADVCRAIHELRVLRAGGDDFDWSQVGARIIIEKLCTHTRGVELGKLSEAAEIIRSQEVYATLDSLYC